MPARDLPARPDLEHLRHEAKTLHREFRSGTPDAVARVRAILGDTNELRLTGAQRVIAREYGFRGWAALRAHVHAARGAREAVDAFLGAVLQRDAKRALDIVRAQPEVATTSMHVAAVLGRVADVRRLIEHEPAQLTLRIGPGAGDPLLWLCYSPFHGESAERDDALAGTARVLLDAGADPNTTDDRYGVSALYAVCGFNHAPRIARMLLDAGANPTDGESVFHAAERFHEEALELLLEYGVRLNAVGAWGNTPLYFLLRYWNVHEMPRVRQGLLWLLDHGADPDVRCGREQETSLHVAVRRGQHPDVVELLIRHGADVTARRGDGRTPWSLARRGGFDALAALLERHGAPPEPLSPTDALLAACGHGAADAARALATPALIDALTEEEKRILTAAAAEGRTSVVTACLGAGFPVDTTDEAGATALHHAAIHGNAAAVRALLHHGADFRIRDSEHHAPALGWATFGADHVAAPDGDYVATVTALLEAGARPDDIVYRPAHEGVRAVLVDR